jgi:hypothetical protein
MLFPNLMIAGICEQVIAMSAPVFGRHSSYRNDIHVVSRLVLIGNSFTHP